MQKNKDHIALKFLTGSKNNLVDQSEIYGGVEMNGESNKIKRSKIDIKKTIQEHPIKTIIIGSIITLTITIIGSVIGLIIEYTFFK